MFNRDKPAVSLAKSKTVRGVTVRKMPIGAFLQALERIAALPGDLLSVCFPGMTAGEALSALSKLDEDGLLNIATGIMLTAPRYLCGFIADVCEVPEETLLYDDNIGAAGMIEIILAFIEVNELKKFLCGVRELRGKWAQTKILQSFGFKG